ncbi:MAG: ACP S-malonyltransferase [Lachnospiraceae bacterium]|nr:ACP S-malonyltransferase [Lachnospiraceae bacterium]
MGKTAIIFPGQGVQYIGMGKDFFEGFDEAARIFEKASEVTGLDIKRLCFTENEELNKTEYTQISMITTELAVSRVMSSKGIKPDMCAGLSLGEYAALSQANVMDDEDIFRIVRKRGIFMQNAYPEDGALTAGLGLDAQMTTDICAEVCSRMQKHVSVANYNCPGQLVITGEKEAVDAAAKDCLSAGAKKCIPLNVSGPFHSLLLKDASEKLGTELSKVVLSDPQIPYYTNVTAEAVSDKNAIKDLLTKQICSPVKWMQSIEKMIADGADTFIEAGPGRSLAGFMKRIDKDVKVYSIGTVEEMKKYLEVAGC